MPSDGAAVAQQKPYRDEELLRELYDEKKLSTNKIGDRLDCSPTTVRKYLKEFGIELRSQAESLSYHHGNHPNEVPINIHGVGYPRWNHTYRSGDKHGVFVHRLLAVAEFGFEAVAENEVHHKNGIHWDNRPDNLELMDHDTHMSQHRKITPEQRQEVAEMYEKTDLSSYGVADEVDFDISQGTVIRIHREIFGSES